MQKIQSSYPNNRSLRSYCAQLPGLGKGGIQLQGTPPRALRSCEARSLSPGSAPGRAPAFPARASSGQLDRAWPCDASLRLSRAMNNSRASGKVLRFEVSVRLALWRSNLVSPTKGSRAFTTAFATLPDREDIGEIATSFPKKWHILRIDQLRGMRTRSPDTHAPSDVPTLTPMRLLPSKFASFIAKGSCATQPMPLPHQCVGNLRYAVGEIFLLLPWLYRKGDRNGLGLESGAGPVAMILRGRDEGRVRAARGQFIESTIAQGQDRTVMISYPFCARRGRDRFPASPPRRASGRVRDLKCPAKNERRTSHREQEHACAAPFGARTSSVKFPHPQSATADLSGRHPSTFRRFSSSKKFSISYFRL